MLLYVLETVYSGPFLVGAVCGAGLWMLYCRQKARYLDKYDPLPDGKRHAISRMSRQWIAGLCAAMSLGYVLLATDRAERNTARLNAEVTACWTETYQQIRTQVRINAENDTIIRKQQELQRDYDRATSDWLKALIQPPGNLANLPTTDPRRQQYGIDITGRYQLRLNDLGAQADDLTAQRDRLDKEREAHPLPEARCGKN
jgi:hypothetical protein